MESRVSLLLLTIVVPFSGFVWSKILGFGISPVPTWLNYGQVVLSSWILIIPIIAVTHLYRLAIDGPAHPLVAFIKILFTQMMNRDWFLRLVILVVLALLLGSFTVFKSIIPRIQPFVYDYEFMIIDRLIFFGQDPWRVTHALFGDALSTWVLQQFYIYWFALMWFSLAFVTLRSDLRRLRARYLLAFSLSFIVIGSFSALILSSAGPCYFGWATGGPDVYEPLMSRLRDLDAALRSMSPPLELNALLLQDYLKAAHDKGEIVFGGGISAMPSMHVAVAALVALAAWSYQRWLGILLAPFVLIIWIGSIHLGWHYAIDGPVALLLTMVIWWLSGIIVSSLGIVDNLGGEPGGSRWSTL